MNPARTLGPAVASGYYKGIWVYFIGPVIGTLLAAWAYNLIQLTDRPVYESSSPFSFRLRRLRSNEVQLPVKNTLDLDLT